MPMLLQRFARVHRWLIHAVVLMLLFAFPSASHAIPAFARMYGLSCSTCHIDFPKLNEIIYRQHPAFMIRFDDRGPPTMVVPDGKVIVPRVAKRGYNCERGCTFMITGES